jgi:hypothetical protein
MLKRVTSVRSGRQAPSAAAASPRCPCGAEGTPLGQDKPLQRRVSGRRALRSREFRPCWVCEDAVVGCGRRGEHEHESRDAPAEHAEVVSLEGMVRFFVQRPARLIDRPRARRCEGGAVLPGESRVMTTCQMTGSTSDGYEITFTKKNEGSLRGSCAVPCGEEEFRGKRRRSLRPRSTSKNALV